MMNWTKFSETKSKANALKMKYKLLNLYSAVRVKEENGVWKVEVKRRR